MNDKVAGIDEIVARALDEDRAAEDVTTALLVDRALAGEASIVAKAPGVISGQECAAAAFRLAGAPDYRALVPDGGRAGAGDTIAVVAGPLAAILSGERTALNFLGHLSGVATATDSLVSRIGDGRTRILDTRKTTPGLRRLEKKAVRDGGGMNHRHDLASYILVKENHIAAAGGIGKVSAILGRRIALSEVEVTSLAELRLLESAPPGRIMLDNFSPAMVAEAVGEIRRWTPPRPAIEVSGGINAGNVAEYAMPGVDFISSGSITSSAASLDLSLLVVKEAER